MSYKNVSITLITLISPYLFQIRDHIFSTFAEFSKKLTMLEGASLEAYFGSYQIFMVELFVKLVNGYKAFSIFVKALYH